MTELNLILDLDFFSKLAEKSTIFEMRIEPKGNDDACVHSRMLQMKDLWLKHWSIQSKMIRLISSSFTVIFILDGCRNILERACYGFLSLSPKKCSRMSEQMPRTVVKFKQLMQSIWNYGLHYLRQLMSSVTMEVFPQPVLPCKHRGDLSPFYKKSIYWEIWLISVIRPGTLAFRCSSSIGPGFFRYLRGFSSRSYVISRFAIIVYKSESRQEASNSISMWTGSMDYTNYQDCWEFITCKYHAIIIQIEMRIKKGTSVSKISKDSQEKQKMNMTTTSAMFSYKQLKEPRLPPLRPALRKTSTKLGSIKTAQQKYRKETETTITESQMLQSYYQTVDKGWTKPSEYLKEIKEANLIAQDNINLQNYQIKLNEKVEKNIGKLDMLFELMQKWVSMLRKILQYTTTKRNSTPYLIQEVRFWKALSKKFDQLQYEFNNQKTEHLLTLMKNSIKVRSEFKANFDQFVRLKDNVVEKTPLLRKLYLSLEESVSGNIQRFAQSSDIVTSIELLKRCFLAFQMIAENNEIMRGRMEVVYDKMNEAMIQKLSAASIYPRQLANISSLKQKYAVVDKALSFYSNFIGVMEESEDQQILLILEKAEYTRNVLLNLLHIMGYFQFLYNKKQVLEFSKLFSVQFQENIFSYEAKDQWINYMANVDSSTSSKKYEP